MAATKRTWKKAKAHIILRFPANLPEAQVLDISRRVRNALRTDMENDGQEVFGDAAPRVERSIHFEFSNE